MENFSNKLNSSYLRQGSALLIPKAETTRATNSFDFRAAMAWNHLSSELKCFESLSPFKKKKINSSIYIVNIVIVNTFYIFYSLNLSCR